MAISSRLWLTGTLVNFPLSHANSCSILERFLSIAHRCGKQPHAISIRFHVAKSKPGRKKELGRKLLSISANCLERKRSKKTFATHRRLIRTRRKPFRDDATARFSVSQPHDLLAFDGCDAGKWVLVVNAHINILFVIEWNSERIALNAILNPPESSATWRQIVSKPNHSYVILQPSSVVLKLNCWNYL